MSPPGPSTPTPRRFLLSKRNQRQSVSGFQSTPRFQAPSSSGRAPATTSSQRAPPITSAAAHDVRTVAPVKLALTQGKQRSLEDVDDEDDERVEVSSEEESRDEEERERDAIEISSSPWSQDESEGEPHDRELDSSHEGEEGPRSGAVAEDGASSSSSSSPNQRGIKRRRLSITPLPAFSSSSTQEQQDDGTRSEERSGIHVPSDADSTSTIGSPSRRDAQQPTFRQVPRFKPLDPDLSTPGLPAAFSPQRRGAKYLTGGLAAELQSMLSAVISEDQEHASSTTIQVKEVRAGRRMYLVRDQHDRRIVLAGEGKLTGLGRRALVVQGSVVDIGQLGWGAEIEGERWEVHCDWSIVT